MKACTFILLIALFLPLQIFSEEPEKAKVVTNVTRGAQCISPVHINVIDGRQVAVGRAVFELEPGQHSMSGEYVLDTTFCKVLGPPKREKVPPLEAYFTAGKTYYVGIDHSAPNRNDWRYVIWKVEDSK
jgi:hypothetical protein